MDWPELRGKIPLEYETDAVLGDLNPASAISKARLKKERAHEKQLREIRHEMDMQKEALERLLHPAGIEERIRQFRMEEKERRSEREERIRLRYEKQRQMAEMKAQKRLEVVPKPPPRRLGALPPLHDPQDFALKDIRAAKASEQEFARKAAKQHDQVLTATKRLVVSILSSGVDKKGFLRVEATLVQQFARVAVSRRVAQRLRLKSQSPVVLSLVSRSSSQADVEARLDFVRDVVGECIDNAKILLTKEYVMSDVQSTKWQ